MVPSTRVASARVPIARCAARSRAEDQSRKDQSDGRTVRSAYGQHNRTLNHPLLVRKSELFLQRAEPARMMSNVRSRRHTVISVSAREASPRRKIRHHLRTLGFHKSDQGGLEIAGIDKELIRTMQSSQR